MQETFFFQKILRKKPHEKRIKEFNHLLEVAQLKKNQMFKNKQELLKNIAQTHLTIFAQTGQSDKLFGSITSADIASALEQKGLLIDRKQVL